MRRAGKIFVGFPGIGMDDIEYNTKDGFVYLSADAFDKSTEWPNNIIQVATSLKDQGFYVMIPGHYDMIKTFKNSVMDFTTVYPSVNLKNSWVDMLAYKLRIQTRPLNKLKWEYIRDNFDEMIKEYSHHPYTCEIDLMMADLHSVLMENIFLGRARHVYA